MSAATYILYSKKLDRFYVGITEHLKRRVKQHLAGASRWTSRADDWHEVYRQRTTSMAEARTLEKHIKSRGAKRYLRETEASFPIPPKAGQGCRFRIDTARPFCHFTVCSRGQAHERTPRMLPA